MMQPAFLVLTFAAALVAAQSATHECVAVPPASSSAIVSVPVPVSTASALPVTSSVAVPILSSVAPPPASAPASTAISSTSPAIPSPSQSSGTPPLFSETGQGKPHLNCFLDVVEHLLYQMLSYFLCSGSGCLRHYQHRRRYDCGCISSILRHIPVCIAHEFLFFY